MPCMQLTSSRRSGFTLVEVLVVAPVILLSIAVFVGTLIFITGEVLVTRQANSLAHSTQSALDTIERDIRASSGFLATNSISPLVTPQGRNNGTQPFNNVASGQNSALILNMIATSGAPQISQREPVWLRDTPNPCGSDEKIKNQPLMYNVVYYWGADGGLWRRTILPANYDNIGCTTPDQRPSCAPGSSESICVADDVRLLSGVKQLDINYFTSAASISPVAGASNTSLSSAVRQNHLGTTDTVSVAISVSRPVSSRDIDYSSSIRATRVGTQIDP